MKVTARNWKKLLVWASAYVNVIVFALVGGYFMLKDDDEEVKRSVKYALLLYLAFTASVAVLNLYSYIGNALDWDYGSWVYELYAALTVLNNIARIVVFATFACIAFFKKNDCCCKEKAEENEDKPEEQPAVEVEDVKEE